uniref:BAR domain-containing protein n=1 Tax=Schistocephalus solidus TaxID=70667 RepID=A0A0X3PH85_SCHSO
MSNIGTVFNRLSQKAGESFTKSEKTAPQAETAALLAQLDKMKPWCNQMIAAVEQFIDVTAATKVVDVFAKNKEKTTPADKITTAFKTVGEEATGFPKMSAYLTSSAAAHAHMAEAKKKFNENVNQNFLQILKDFVNKDLADALRQKNEMEKARLDLDSAKNKLKNAKTEENKAKFKAEVEKFQATYDREQDETTVMLRDTHNAFEKLKDAFKQFAAEEKAYYSTCMEECAKLCELP